ncbi:MAG: hypothetical protein AAGK05_09830 [Pseudomonadota bacterium]
METGLEESAVQPEDDYAYFDGPSLSDDLDGFSDRETMSYVVGALLKRLDCNECTIAMKKDVVENQSIPKNFTQFMTYPGASMITPIDVVLDEFCNRLKPILLYYDKCFHKRHVVKTVCMKFRFKQTFPVCSQVHGSDLLKFFACMLLRCFCKTKNKNLNLKDNRARKKFAKLNV